jgi:hypothetical protein
VTYEGGDGYCHKSVQIITDPGMAAQLHREVDGKRQLLYSGVVRCRECNYGRALADAEASRSAA